MTEFWYKLVDMAKSDAKIVSLWGLSLTEKQLLWFIGILAVIILVLLLRSAILWIFRPATTSSSKDQSKVNKPVIEEKQPIGATTATTTAPNKESVPTESTEPKTATSPETPQTMLTDTSDKKRSMHDYVTPDSVSADVAKKTLTNDYPYETLKPDPTKVGQVPVIPPTASVDVSPVPKVEVPVTHPAPVAVETVATTSVQTTASTVPPVEVATPVQTTETAPSIVETANVAPPEPSVAAPKPKLPEVSVPPVTAPVIEPANTPPAETATAPTATATTVTPRITILPPLPPKEPTSHMVVGVADESAQPIKKTTFNPTDPVLP